MQARASDRSNLTRRRDKDHPQGLADRFDLKPKSRRQHRENRKSRRDRMASEMCASGIIGGSASMPSNGHPRGPVISDRYGRGAIPRTRSLRHARRREGCAFFPRQTDAGTPSTRPELNSRASNIDCIEAGRLHRSSLRFQPSWVLARGYWSRGDLRFVEANSIDRTMHRPQHLLYQRVRDCHVSMAESGLPASCRRIGGEGGRPKAKGTGRGGRNLLSPLKAPQISTRAEKPDVTCQLGAVLRESA